MIEASEHRPTQAIVDLSAIKNNVQWMKEQLDNDQILFATVKANGYGHGAYPVAKAALQAGAQGLLVATVDEGIELRKKGLTRVPILVLGLTDARGIAEILHFNLTVTVSSSDFFEKAYRQLESMQQLELLNLYTLNFHLAVDTGMGRIGLQTVEEIKNFCKEVQKYEWANWEGVFTHFSTVGGGPVEYIETQFERWDQLLEEVPASVTYRHYANSAAGMWYPHQPKTDIVRFGIAMYGIDPLDRLENTSNQLPLAPLKPALQLISELVYVKKVEKGRSISYGATYTTKEDEWIGTIPIGYADGWLRSYHTVEVIINGHRCPVVGVINMDQMMVKLPYNIPVETTVTLIGKDGDCENHVIDIAQKLGTISYEIFCNLSERIPRVYLK